MKQQEDEFLSEPQELQDIIPIKQQHDELPPKLINQTQKKPQLKRVHIEREKQFYLYRPFKIEKAQSSSEEEDNNFKPHELPFKQFYAEGQCVYMRHNNSSFNRFNKQTYYAGQFVNKNIFLQSSNCNQTHELTDILRQYYDIDPVQLPQTADTALIFDSRFQSGNLFAAMKIGEYQYDLVMQNDTNAIGSNQWFYFSVTGLKVGRKYTFSVVNYTKSDSLFNYGMKPAVYSLKENNNVFDVEKGWKRDGEEVVYKKGKLPREGSHRMYYRLTFKITANYDQDKLWISHSYPYTYTKLNQMIHEKRTKYRQCVGLLEIGKTLSKRSMEAMVIAHPINKKRDNRKAVIIMARQHPGQTQGSYVCEGVIDKLLSRTKEVDLLLKNFIFYVIPMINPDGVVFGHYRTNLAGKDLNRKWNTTEKDVNCPEVTVVKNFLSDLSKNREIRFILDLHGHSRKLNSFFYGNPYPDSPQSVRIFPFICSKLHPGVQYYQCTFATQQYKRKAARVYLNYMFKLVHVYTFQSSFYGYHKEGKTIEFTQKEYRCLGGSLISGLSLQLEHQLKYQEVLEFNIRKNKEYLSSPFVKYLLELKNNSALLAQGAEGESGSESKPQEGEIENEDVEYGKIKRVPSSMKKDHKGKSNKITRKAASQMKDLSFARPTRNLKYLQISKINSFLPQKDGFCLQPIRKKEAEPSNKNLKTVASCQTQMNMSHQQLFKDFSFNEVQQANLSYSFIAEQQTDKRNSSIRPMHNKNNVIFRLEYMTNVSEHYSAQRKKKPIKNALSQTLMTFSSPQFSKEKKERTQHYSEHVSEREEGSDWWLKAGQIKLQTPFSSLMLKKDAAVYFNGMVQKLMTRKDHSRSHDMPMSRLDRSFSIKKKETRR